MKNKMTTKKIRRRCIICGSVFTTTTNSKTCSPTHRKEVEEQYFREVEERYREAEAEAQKQRQAIEFNQYYKAQWMEIAARVKLLDEWDSIDSVPVQYSTISFSFNVPESEVESLMVEFRKIGCNVGTANKIHY